ncbi:ABC transporter permease [Paenibacillus thailandensis]|uniref:ABC transporter permease n=1 Tax=Paenibacillus thailandensis TaxID=393250 RepID=A0ABW5R2M0_9BACL
MRNVRRDERGAKRLKVYVMFGLKAFINQLSYRSEVWLRLFGNFVAILIQSEIWKSVLGNGQADGIAADQMVTYSIINTLLFSLLLHGVSGKVDESLKSGSIASELVKPLTYPFFLLSNGLGNALYQFVFTVIPSVLLAWFCFGIVPPSSGFHASAFILALGMAVAISFLLGYLISLIAFWLLNHFALNWMMGGLMTIFSGSFLPLWYFPDSLKAIAGMLPFQYLGYFPAAVYLGTIPAAEVPLVFAKGLLWIALLLVIVNRLWRKAIRRLIVQGG